MMPADRSTPPPLGPDPSLSFPHIAKNRLPTGFSIWTVDHRAVPLTTFLVLLPVGAAADPPDRPGLAALTGDLLDEGAGGFTALQLHETLASLGARLDTDVGADATMLTLTVLSRNAHRAAALLSDLVCRPRFDPAEFERVRERRLHRLIQLRDLPPAQADRGFLGLLYPDHPYGHQALGTEDSVRAMTLDDVSAFHERAYTSARATLIVIGDRGDGTAAAAFAGFERRTTVLDGGTLEAPPAPRARLALVHRDGAAQSELRLGCVTTARDTPDYHALLVLNMVLGGQFVSRVNLNLREDKGYTYGVRSSFDLRRGPGPFVLQMSVQTDKTASAIEESLNELRDIGGSRPVAPAELDAACAALTRGYPRSFETASQIARACAQLALYDLPDDYFTEFVPRVRAIDAEAVTAAARRYLDPAGIVALVVGDRERVLPHIEQVGLGPVTELGHGA